MMLMRCHHDVDRDGDGGTARWLSGQFGVLEVLGEKHMDLTRYLQNRLQKIGDYYNKDLVLVYQKISGL